MMKLPPYIDIHRHESDNADAIDVWTLYSKYEGFQNLAAEKQYSLGIHPWYIQDELVQLKELETSIGQNNVRAIGECGLDALRGAPAGIQEVVFKKQIALANAYNKPLIIHCVRAFPQAIALLKQAKVPVIFHGFNKKQSIAEELLKQGYYLSFGAALLKEDSAAFAALDTVPAGRFFFETDDSISDIAEIYEAGCRIRKTALETIILQVQENFKTIFDR